MRVSELRDGVLEALRKTGLLGTFTHVGVEMDNFTGQVTNTDTDESVWMTWFSESRGLVGERGANEGATNEVMVYALNDSGQTLNPDPKVGDLITYGDRERAVTAVQPFEFQGFKIAFRCSLSES